MTPSPFAVLLSSNRLLEAVNAASPDVYCSVNYIPRSIASKSDVAITLLTIDDCAVYGFDEERSIKADLTGRKVSRQALLKAADAVQHAPEVVFALDATALILTAGGKDYALPFADQPAAPVPTVQRTADYPGRFAPPQYTQHRVPSAPSNNPTIDTLKRALIRGSRAREDGALIIVIAEGEQIQTAFTFHADRTVVETYYNAQVIRTEELLPIDIDQISSIIVDNVS